ncbi:hypothetical protein Tco_0861583 [Tanacetum coccineum]|uniref:Uncharacterized protein n=1 Tax=Tanacetum coccineum TaxID=301880 RepID=A0ABQ5BI74_9ASTR
MEERSSYMKIEEVRIKASQHEEGCFNAIEGSGKKYQIRSMELAVVVLNQNYGDDIVDIKEFQKTAPDVKTSRKNV